jgi:hypothetical protein
MLPFSVIKDNILFFPLFYSKETGPAKLFHLCPPHWQSHLYGNTEGRRFVSFITAKRWPLLPPFCPNKPMPGSLDKKKGEDGDIFY